MGKVISTIVLYIGMLLWGLVFVLADMMPIYADVCLAVSGTFLIYCSIFDWKGFFTNVFEKICDKVEQRLKPVELDDWYLPLKEEPKKKQYFYDLKEMRG